MLRRAPALAAAAACALLAGCSQANGAGSARPSASSAANATFGRLVDQRGLGDKGSPAALRDAAGSICAGYTHGRSYDEMITDLTDSGWSAHDARELNDAAVTAYCPHEGRTTPAR